MNIMHVADLHGNIGWFQWLKHEAPRFNLVVIAGDLIDLGVYSGLRPGDQADAIAEVLRDFPVPLAICSGNHDQFFFSEKTNDLTSDWLQALRRPGLWTDGDRFTLGNVHFRCLEWGEALPEVTREREVWLVHVPANQTAPAFSRIQQADWGDFEHGELCRASRGPWLSLCGHVHSPKSWHGRAGRTLILNPGCEFGQTEPNRIEIDLERGTAVWRAAGGVSSPPIVLP